jgi:epoxyqueuosine reductase
LSFKAAVSTDGQRALDAERLKTQALRSGFDAVRVTSADAAPRADRLRTWLDAGLNGEMRYLERRHRLRTSPLSSQRLLARARSVVMLAVSYAPDRPEARPQGMPAGTVARYARGADYHPVLWGRLNALRDWLEATWPGEHARGYADSGPIRERELAARSGLGWIGKHTGLISLDLGNWFFLAALLTTLPLTPDDPVEDHCGTCTRCLAACPTGALIAPHTMDARRCISYLTIELQGTIPRELRPALGDRIFGCDDCLAACPWNERARAGRDVALAARDDDAGHPDLLAWLALLADEAAFQDRFRATALLRPGRTGLRRNVCVALGNVGGPESIPGLTDALRRDAAAVVRGHAAWALGEIVSRLTESAGGAEALVALAARQALQAAVVDEPDDCARSEIVEALHRVADRNAVQERAALPQA